MYPTEKKSLNALGFNLQKRNILFLPIGLLLGIAAFVVGFYLRAFVTGERWNINTNIDFAKILNPLYWGLQAALVQEFVVRGYCFKKIIQLSNQTTAIIICGLVFIAMHNVWNGDINQFLGYSLLLFIGHLLFCAGLLRSGTIYFAIGLHWGNNLANSNLFTIGRTDTSIVFTTIPHPRNMNLSDFWLLFLLANIGFIMLIFLIWKWKPKRNVAIA
jgi:membrane protease YdiL (CAAX protease family)